MENYFWDSKLEYLLETRKKLWNKDYFKFLVKDVWKLNSAIDIVDFGCGYGFLGLELLPLIPKDSTYTGLDKSEVLIAKAKDFFKNCPYKTNFINVDLNEYIPKQNFDVAICQAVLRHLPNGKQILKKMIDSVKKGGMVITIEVNRKIEDSGFYIEGLGEDMLKRSHYMEKIWLYEKNQGIREYDFGSQIPIFMKEMRLKDIGVRLSDCVEFIDCDENYNSTLKRDFNKDYLIKASFTEKQIQELFSINEKISKHLDLEKPHVVNIRGLIISFGIK